MNKRSWRICVDGKPPTQNQVRRMHHHEEARVKREWKELFVVACRLARVTKGLNHIEVHVRQRYRRGVSPDVDAAAPAAKAAIDALVVCGVIADDDPTHMSRVTYHAPVRATIEGLDLLIVESVPVDVSWPELTTQNGGLAWGAGVHL